MQSYMNDQLRNSMNNKAQWDAAAFVIGKIEEVGFEAVVVGGAVRDYYLQKAMHDIDIATSATPQEVKAIFTQTVDVGIEHGTVLVLDGAEPIEVTTYRTEGTYKDHRRPDEVVFVRTLRDDMQRRDFTMNAMALTKDFRMIDYYGGAADIEAKLIRAVGDASSRFEEDALRMLRAIRFAAQLGFSIEATTFAAIRAHAATIKKISIERIDMELAKLFVSNYAPLGIQLLIESGLAAHLTGEWNAADWQLFSSKNADVGWAYVAYLNEQCEPFILIQYKCSNKTKQFAKQVLEASQALEDGWTALHAFTFDEVVIETAHHFRSWQHETLDQTLEQLLMQKRTLPIATKEDLAVTGHDFIKWADQKSGPWLKDALQQALEAVLEGRIANEQQQLKDWFTHGFINKG